MSNQVKSLICERVKDAVHDLDGGQVSWNDHTIPFYGRFPAGQGKISVTDVSESETTIRVSTQGMGSRHFLVKVSEQI